MMKEDRTSTKEIPTQIKDQDLVKLRRKQISDAAVKLFIKKGFHKTTTRQIASAAGFSIGSLYEYIASKEDVLYLVCESIYPEVKQGLEGAMERASGGKNALSEVIREYFKVCDRMCDFILLMYQETRSLPLQWQKKVLYNELRITGLIQEVLNQLVSTDDLPPMTDRAIELAAHNISVLGHMWTFRRWSFSRTFSLEEYIELQTEFILGISR